jgi:hypothetical protein
MTAVERDPAVSAAQRPGGRSQAFLKWRVKCAWSAKPVAAIREIPRRALSRGVRTSAYVEEMFARPATTRPIARRSRIRAGRRQNRRRRIAGGEEDRRQNR